MRAKVKIIAFILVLIITLNINIRYESKHFLQVEIPKVEAASVNINIPEAKSYVDGYYASASANISMVDYNTLSGELTVTYKLSYSYYVQSSYDVWIRLVVSTDDFANEIIIADAFNPNGQISDTNTISSTRTINIGKGQTSIKFRVITFMRTWIYPQPPGEGDHKDSPIYYLNSNPVLSLTQPSSNSPLLALYGNVKEDA